MTDTPTSRKLLGEHGRNWRHYDEQGDHAPVADQPDPWIAFRTYRAISWLDRAEREGADDMDASFIFLWIAFDAAYGSAKSGRRFAMDRFFQEILGADAENTIYTAIWERFSGVRDARAIMAFLVPVLLNIMIESRQQLALGEPSYYLRGGGA